MKKYTFLADKLVRNHAPEQMQAQGIDVHFGTISEEKKEFYIKKKLLEEVQELSDSADRDHVVSELCDVFEAACLLLELYGIEKNDFLKRVDQKRKEKGGYDQFLHLKTLTLPENHSRISHYLEEKNRYPEIPT